MRHDAGDVCDEVVCDHRPASDRRQRAEQAVGNVWLTSWVERECSAALASTEVLHIGDQRGEHDTRPVRDGVSSASRLRISVQGGAPPQQWPRIVDEPTIGDDPLSVEGSARTARSVRWWRRQRPLPSTVEPCSVPAGRPVVVVDESVRSRVSLKSFVLRAESGSVRIAFSRSLSTVGVGSWASSGLL